MVDPALKLAQREKQRLEEILESNPDFRKWKKWADVVAEYEVEPKVVVAAPPVASATAGQPVVTSIAAGVLKASMPQVRRSYSADIVAAATNYLREIGHRAKAKEITDAVLKGGIAVNGHDKAGTVAAHLSNAKATFDNVKGEGYGLIEWTLEGRQTSFGEATMN